MDREDQYSKNIAGPKVLYYWYGGADSVPTYPRRDSLKTPKESFNIGGDGSISKDIETQKGLQFWRYYIKLQNNLRLRLSSSFNYAYEESRPPKQAPIRNRDVLTGTVKPEVSYNFTNNVDALFFVQYKYDKLWHTSENESTHEVQVHGEFTMRF
ncbi:MAG TPA: hypothetical protein VK465_07820, partial [Fibrobacteria bacterium]|nr:hypothetical protein [Fibrobacteria bacterium]